MVKRFGAMPLKLRKRGGGGVGWGGGGGRGSGGDSFLFGGFFTQLAGVSEKIDR